MWFKRKPCPPDPNIVVCRECYGLFQRHSMRVVKQVMFDGGWHICGESLYCQAHRKPYDFYSIMSNGHEYEMTFYRLTRVNADGTTP